MVASGASLGPSFDKLAQQLRYVAVDYDEPATFDGIREDESGVTTKQFYWPIRPSSTYEPLTRPA